MGNYVLRHVFQKMMTDLSSRPPRIFEHVFLMAADEDDDTFEHAHISKLLPNFSKQVHV